MVAAVRAHFPRFREPSDRLPDRTGLAVEIAVDDVPLRLDGRTIAHVAGAVHLTGIGADYRIDVVFCRDAITDALFQIRTADGPLQALIAEAIASAADAVAIEKLDAAAER